ncbi:S-layer homology domain-containing protein [Cohnella rhizosphaerae]|uniref:S-layer homology domain-containing protein n=1 Tax=Cohnella rhizosphaerae TaxID=1457232 RepID=A0A9X4L6N4_9BACL|nr:S-layer homology domain-containing protein [Cohnella rhizosphaerae]MDG0814462.1 S-layer homology domain-containing protein [Cohnella rhizosphaerae]
MFGGSDKTGAPVTKVDIVRTTDAKGGKTDAVKLTEELAAKTVEQLKALKSKQAVIVIPDTKDEVNEINLSLPRSAVLRLTEGGIGLIIEMRGVTIDIPTTSLSASGDDLYFKVVPIKDAAAQRQAEQRAKENGGERAGELAIVGRPMTIETNLQQQPVLLSIPLGNYPADRVAHLKVYIEHSDGTTEWAKGEAATDTTGGTAIRFTVRKFSTFTVVDGAADASRAAYIQGYGDGTFRPNQAVTRGELAAMLARLYADASVNGAVYAASYKDQAAFAGWASESIGQATALGLVQGYEDGTFRADQAVTRAEAATLAVRIAELSSAGQSAAYPDTIGHWAAASIAAAAKAGLVKGYGDGSFAPERALSRAEAAALLNRLTGRSVGGKADKRWIDVPESYWGFADIQAAGMNQ